MKYVTHPMVCPACENKTAPPGMECYLCGPSVKRPKSFATHVTECLDNTAATVRGRRKPHLRLHYIPRRGGNYAWSVQMVRDMRSSYGRPNVTTNQHYTAAGALRAARVFWWPSL